VTSVRKHYDNFLAEHYSWMFGDYDAKVQENIDFFRLNSIMVLSGGKALDLGCGSGFQSIALAELGFKVLAIDLCGALLDELRGRSAGRHVDVIQGDMLDSRIYADKGPFEITVCMGDTLAHLQTVEDVSALFKDVYRSLEPGGKLALTFRDLTAELKGVDRIIPVKSDDDKLMATFLEYENKYVNVHDMIFVRRNSGWELEKSVYRKLRLGKEQVEELLLNTGFNISSTYLHQGFSIIIAQK
jgi:SAM-dependent methyltransferase